MRPTKFLAALCLFGFATMANAQATRTWVSGVGDDVNPCSRTAPCKTFAGAISKTAPNGEIDALDPGGFGTVTITKGMTIDGGGGIIASSLAAGTPAIIVNDGTNTAEVTLRNLSIQGATNGTIGVRFVAGKRLTIEHTRIANFSDKGIDVVVGGTAPLLTLNDVSVENTTNLGINLANTAGLLTIDIRNVYQAKSGTTSGIFLNGAIRGIISDSDFVNNAGAGVTVASTATVGLDHVRATGNNFGVLNASGTPVTQLKDCLLVGNTTNGALSSAGTMTAFQSNVITNASGVTSTAPQ